MDNDDDTTDTAFRSPKADRDQRKRIASRMLRAALEDTGASREIVAAHLGKSRTKLAREMDDGDLGAPVQLETVLGLPPLARLHVTRALAQLDGCAVAEVPVASTTGLDELRRHARLLRELTDVLNGHLEAVADGHLSAVEADHLERQIDEAVQEMMALRLVCQMAKRERVLGLVVGVTR